VIEITKFALGLSAVAVIGAVRDELSQCDVELEEGLRALADNWIGILEGARGRGQA
jgi:hypothetical protein